MFFLHYRSLPQDRCGAGCSSIVLGQTVLDAADDGGLPLDGLEALLAQDSQGLGSELIERRINVGDR